MTFREFIDSGFATGWSVYIWLVTFVALLGIMSQCSHKKDVELIEIEHIKNLELQRLKHELSIEELKVKKELGLPLPVEFTKESVTIRENRSTTSRSQEQTTKE